jgi:hypothetical protein
MSTWLIILIIFLAITGYMLFFPLTVKIDTDNENYFIRLPGVLGFRVMKGMSGWKIRYSVLFMRFYVKLFQPGEHRKKLDKENLKSKKRTSGWRSKMDYALMGINIMRTFRLKKLRWSIDTDDYPLNAQLIPLVSFLNNDRVNVSVNFNDYNAFYIVLQTYLFRIIYVTIRYFMFNR